MADYRYLGDGDFETDGLPLQSKFGPLETRFTRGKIKGQLGPHWLARCHKLPGYLGNGNQPHQAIAALEDLLALKPLYSVEITRINGVKQLRRIVPRLLASLYAAAELGDGKRSDFVVDPIVDRYKVRKSDILRTAAIWRKYPSTSPKYAPLLAAGQEFANEKAGMLPRIDPPTAKTANPLGGSLSLSSIQFDHVAEAMFHQRDIWEWEAIFARMKFPASAI